jgi:hypothetical protein
MAQRRLVWLIASVLAVAALPVSQVAAKPPSSFNPVVEAENFSITQQRQTTYDTPQYQEQLAVDSATSTAQATSAEANDPERFFTDDLCWNLSNGCAGDIRLNDWGPNGYGIVRPILFTARDGATISGHVWATIAGPAKRPGIVITNGSVQADENMYWYAAQALAKDRYVVLTFDPQGQGQSDTLGESPDQSEGVPAQTDGRPFYDGTEDATDFLLSTPQHPYESLPSCSSGASHAPKQDRRVKAGLDAGYNPPWQLTDDRRIGLPGRSRRPHDGPDHQARARHVGRLRAAANAERLASEPHSQGAGVAGIHQGRRRHGRADHPRRIAPGLQLHPQPGLRRIVARPGHDRLVYERLV